MKKGLFFFFLVAVKVKWEKKGPFWFGEVDVFFLGGGGFGGVGGWENGGVGFWFFGVGEWDRWEED